MVETDERLIKRLIPNCIGVQKTDIDTDKSGIDYTARLSGGAEIGIDVKTRDKGASKYWKHGEAELALEIWSVCPVGGRYGKIGWTLSESSNVDMILYKFDVTDSLKVYIFPFQFLRMAFMRNGKEWVKRYSRKRQNSGSWSSEAVFVPASEVKKAIMSEMEAEIIDVTEKEQTA